MATEGRVLVLNAGSSSIKAKVFDVRSSGGTEAWHLELGGIGGVGHKDHADATAHLFQALAGDGFDKGLVGVGHRIVHGGDVFDGPVRVTPDVLAELRRFIPLAPHHQPHNLAAIQAVAANHPDLAQVACFDTAFHQTMPAEARETGLPADYAGRGIRRYGFHGLSYRAVVDSFATIAGVPLPRRVIALHLGNGASLCAIEGGRSIATTMGFSTLDGIPMGTRSGAVDPGVLLHLMRADGLDADGLEDLLYNRCGLLGLSGESADMKALLSSGSEGARHALAVYAYRISREVGSLAAALGGVDALVFTGGIGANAAPVRAAVLDRCAWLGVHLDAAANDRGGPLLSGGGTPSAWVIPPDEEAVIARETVAVLD